jgi:hypothetical protein
MPALSLTDRLMVPRDVLFRNLGGEGVLVNLTTGVYYGLDPLGTRIWDLLVSGMSLAQVLQTILAEYDVTLAQAQSDLQVLVQELTEKRLLAVA